MNTPKIVFFLTGKRKISLPVGFYLIDREPKAPKTR